MQGHASRMKQLLVVGMLRKWGLEISRAASADHAELSNGSSCMKEGLARMPDMDGRGGCGRRAQAAAAGGAGEPSVRLPAPHA